MFDSLYSAIEILARGGGGGSGGGSGGGGGGGELLALLGYIPSYYIGLAVKRVLPRKAELIVSITSATAITILLLVLTSNSGGLGVLVAVMVIIGVWAGWYAAFFGVMEKLKNRIKKTKDQVAVAAASDSAWDSASLKQQYTAIFMQYQKDWSQFNLNSIISYTTPEYARHAGLMLRTLKEMHRTNTMSNIEILQSGIVEMHDSSDDSHDSFQVAFHAKAEDTLWDTRSETALYTDTSEFTEFWTFVRKDDRWLLSGISQGTAEIAAQNSDIKAFAERNGMYYSLDMGWLFLPRRGVLFKGGAFKTSDINNHVVGLYNDNLIQLYTYEPTANYSILVAQINLPKSYEGILIRRKASFFSAWKPPKAPSNYQRYTMEWADFNGHYTVHATNQDSLATFELLNPGFMAYLYDADTNVSIEVADNVVYLYKLVAANKKVVNPIDEYEKLLTILYKAFKELRL